MNPLISESKDGFPILIVDKIGDIGLTLAQKLSENSTVVFATEKSFQSIDNIIHIPYRKKIPKIPDNLYSHVFVIDDGEDITLEALPSFFKKAQEDHAVFSFATSVKRKKIPSEIFEYRKSRALFIGDVFPSTGFFPESYVNSFLIKARSRGRIDIPQDGMTISYPIFYDDVVSGIMEASFGTSSETVYYILPKDGVTLLSLAHAIQKKDPDIKIDFTNEDASSPKLTLEGKFIFPNYPLAERIRSLNNSNLFRPEAEKHEGKKRNDELPRLITFSFIFFLFLPLVSTLLFASLGFFFLQSWRFSFENSNGPTQFAKSSFNLAQNFSKLLLYETSLVRLDSFTKLSDLIEKGKKETEDISGFYEGIDLLGKGKVNEGTSRIKDFLVFAQTSGKFRTLEKETFDFITQTINVWPQILAVDSTKTYLVIFQNDETQRGSGGVVEAFGILSLENGKITDFKIFDSNEADKNLKGHVEPPFALRRYLSSSNFHLADASFDLDFQNVAQTASFFVDLETGNKTDGVIRIGSKTLKKMLGLQAKDATKEQADFAKKFLEGKNLAKIFLTKEYVELLSKKDIELSFNDRSVSAVFENKNKVNEVNDFIGIFETDIEGPSLEKSLSQTLDLNNSEISSVVSLKLGNPKDTEAKKYLRFIVNGNATLKKVLIDEKEKNFVNATVDPAIYEAKNFKAPNALEVETSISDNKKIFGFLATVPGTKASEIEMTFSYQTPSLPSQFSYGLHLIKQPGTNSFPFNFLISFPKEWKIYTEPRVSKEVDRDFDLRFNFTK